MALFGIQLPGLNFSVGGGSEGRGVVGDLKPWARGHLNDHAGPPPAGGRAVSEEEFYRLWGHDSKDQRLRTTDWAHLSNMRIGDKSYDLSSRQGMQDFYNEVMKLCPGAVISNGTIKLPNGTSYDVRHADQAAKLGGDIADGKLDGSVGTPKPANDGVDMGGLQKLAKIMKGVGDPKCPAHNSSTPPPSTPSSNSPSGPNFSSESSSPSTTSSGSVAGPKGNSWEAILMWLMKLIGEKERAAKDATKQLGKDLAAVPNDGNTENATKREDLKQKMIELQGLMDDLKQICEMVSGLQKKNADIQSSIIGRI